MGNDGDGLSPISDLVVRFGGPVSNGLLDPRYQTFRTADGVVGYREKWGSVVAMGDPVCRAADLPRLAAEFREHCSARRTSTVFAAASERLAAVVRSWGGAVVEFGKTLVFDPRRDPQEGSHGLELRKKVKHAKRDGVTFREYTPERSGRDETLERSLEEVAARWLGARQGPQVYIAHIRLFEPRHGRRWFYAMAGERVVGVLALLRLEARGGYLLEHLLAEPGSFVGISELLVTGCLATLGAEGCSFATFGPQPAPQLGAVQNLGGGSEAFARMVFSIASRMFHFDGRERFRAKFQPVEEEPAFLAFLSPRVKMRDVAGLSTAFNVSIW
jgi:lysylphosphatidylglycerol synthetase-like protein (DUF2156 family)